MRSIRKEMWKAMEDSPFLMVALTAGGEHSLPMTAQLDPEADSAFWFYTTNDNRLAPGGPAMAQFVSKGHDLFACISGTLVHETDPVVIDRYWSRHVEAWYAEGRQDPDLKMLRFELDDAEIWTVNPDLKGTFRLMIGKPVDPGQPGDHATVKL